MERTLMGNNRSAESINKSREEIIRSSGTEFKELAGGWATYIDRSLAMKTAKKDIIMTINSSEKCGECREAALEYLAKVE